VSVRHDIRRHRLVSAWYLCRPIIPTTGYRRGLIRVQVFRLSRTAPGKRSLSVRRRGNAKTRPGPDRLRGLLCLVHLLPAKIPCFGLVAAAMDGTFAGRHVTGKGSQTVGSSSLSKNITVASAGDRENPGAIARIRGSHAKRFS